MGIEGKSKRQTGEVKPQGTFTLRPFHYLLLLLSFLLVAFGQPAWMWWIGLLSATCGYALFWRVLLDLTSPKQRFWLSTAWFTCVQGVQISWMLTHPFSYIYFVYPLFCFLLGLQAGFFGLLVTAGNIQSFWRTIALSATWTLLEWSRFFFLTGYSWNPAGLALTGSIYPLQAASLFGVFGLTFWVMLVNFCALRVWVRSPTKRPLILWGLLACLPYLYGAFHLHEHRSNMEESLTHENATINTLLVQTAFSAEEMIPFENKQSYIAFVMDEWRQILNITKNHLGKKIDLIALPEYVVPFGTYTFLYPYKNVRAAFEEIYGSKHAAKLPPTEEPFARQFQTDKGKIWFVNNAFWAQGIANAFDSELIAGLEDAEDGKQGLKYYSAAIHFKPGATAETYVPNRYSKRILLPMAEYIPFSFFQTIAAEYGIQGSFTPGEEATVIYGSNCPFSMSICYEETFGYLMREGRKNGSELLVNLTSDVWYPNSRLPQQHADHARLRTVENGFPLARACNTGITCAFNSIGQTIAILGDEDPNSEWRSDSLYVTIPKYNYPTLYTRFGDTSIIAFCCFAVLLFLIRHVI